MGKNLSEQLKSYRIMKALSQSNMADLIGVSLRTYQNYELGGTRPNNIDVYERIVQVIAFDGKTQPDMEPNTEKDRIIKNLLDQVEELKERLSKYEGREKKGIKAG